MVALLLLAVGLPVRAWGASGDEFNRWVGLSNVLALSLGVVGFLLNVVDRRWHADEVFAKRLDQAADELTDQALKKESRALRGLLAAGQSGSAAADVRFAERLVVFAEAGSGWSGHLGEVGLFYQDHATGGRLVILGDPGSGKTVLAVQLLVQTLEARQEQPDGQTRRLLPVPVRASLPTWNVDVPFEEWLTRRLVADYGMRRQEATALVAARRVLPMLDGLDEMDPQDGDPQRARRAVARLNDEYTAGERGAPLVLTCRNDEYLALGQPVRPATEVVIQPLTPDQIRDYLRLEVGTSARPDTWKGWQLLLDQLDTDVGIELLHALNTPWRLTLAVTYGRANGHPSSLLRQIDASGAEDSDAYHSRVRKLLLEQFIPTRIRVLDSTANTAQITAWLRTVARHLAWQQQHGMAGTDIVLHQWWHIAGSRRVRRWHACTNVALLVAGFAVIFSAFSRFDPLAVTDTVRYYLSPLSVFYFFYILVGAFFVLVITAWCQLAWSTGHQEMVRPKGASLQQLHTPQGRRRLARELPRNLAVGFGCGFVLSAFVVGSLPSEAALVVSLAVSFTFALTFALTAGLTPLDAAGFNPRDALRNDLVNWLALSLAAGLSLLLSLSPWLKGRDWGIGLLFIAAFGFVITLGATLTSGLAANAWLRYVLALWLTRREGILPLGFGRFLNRCHQAGILRESGNAYQFRHLELRDWLQHPPQPSYQAASPNTLTPTDTAQN
ncbi:NACHT domain-containing protein [Actinopolymorpha cephalotaxi]|uniref:NACHT domain-containing protein n=1 Tax=Actinopolymorpha cephalotaxi TaxID=504797 RepID=A0A1I2LZL1_9ACTN|nr:NACHT domain-containing protein [Actinopolymorpha cephalotaxi]NYH81522.1 hypothetical protein [Actinopolymorpha cephalotaxi]SFF84812.1 NACHT domain-containing protein [Actinopolymorpha cephalotaxi]